MQNFKSVFILLWLGTLLYGKEIDWLSRPDSLAVHYSNLRMEYSIGGDQFQDSSAQDLTYRGTTFGLEYGVALREPFRVSLASNLYKQYFLGKDRISVGDLQVHFGTQFLSLKQLYYAVDFGIHLPTSSENELPVHSSLSNSIDFQDGTRKYAGSDSWRSEYRLLLWWPELFLRPLGLNMDIGFRYASENQTVENEIRTYGAIHYRVKESMDFELGLLKRWKTRQSTELSSHIFALVFDITYQSSFKDIRLQYNLGSRLPMGDQGKDVFEFEGKQVAMSGHSDWSIYTQVHFSWSGLKKDSDKDGIPDEKDCCIWQKEDKDNYLDDDGCPDLDNDGDQILDRMDLCPFDAEVYNGIKDEDGCPDTRVGQDTVFFQAKEPLLVEIKEEFLPNDWTVFFETDIDSLNSTSKVVLDEMLAVAKQKPELNFLLTGHTDEIGSEKYNRTLSQKRVSSVENYLLTNGLEQSRMKLSYCGEKVMEVHPSIENSANYNRRVEIKVIELPLLLTPCFGVEASNVE